MGWSPFRQTGLTHCDERSAGGYTLVTPIAGESVYLVDEQGTVVHKWTPEVQPGYAYMLPGGRLLVRAQPERTFDHTTTDLGGQAGVLLELDWDGKELWRWDDPAFHHDMCRLDNGNTLVLAWELVPEEIASRVRGGHDAVQAEVQHLIRRIRDFHGNYTSHLPDGMLADAILEVTPEGKTVNSWHAYEHLDPEIDAICPLEGRREWTHANAVQMTETGQVLISFRTISTVLLIDWPDGKVVSKMGGGLFSHQHDPTMTPEGRILVFDNGSHHPVMPRSRVVEVDPETSDVKWEFIGKPEYSLFSGHISGAERLWNGNTLICEGQSGRVLEVTPEGEICWEWVSPFLVDRHGISASMLFRAHRYRADSEELRGMLS